MSSVGLGSNCPNCGAPRHGNKCEYCGTIFQVEPVASYGANMSTLDALRQELAQAQCNLATMVQNQYLIQSCNSFTITPLEVYRDERGRLHWPR